MATCVAAGAGVAAWGASVAEGCGPVVGASNAAGVAVGGCTMGAGVLVARPTGSTEVGAIAVSVADTPVSITACRGAQAAMKAAQTMIIKAVRFMESNFIIEKKAARPS
jgi:hypothetical protein